VKLFLAIAMGISSPLLALYNGSPSLPQIPEKNLFIPQSSPFSCKLEVQEEILWFRRIDGTSISSPTMHSSLTGGVITWGFVDRVEVYALLSAEKLSLSGNQGGNSFTVKTDPSFSGGVGVRATAVAWGETKLGIDAQYFYGWPQIHSLVIAGDSMSTASAGGWNREWQIGAALSQEFAWFTPYVGVKCAKMKMQLLHLSSLGTVTVENTSSLGVFVGLAIAGSKGIFFDGEVSFLDDSAFSGSLGIRF